MKRSLVFILLLSVLIPGCKKNTIKTSGTATIDNTLYGTDNFYALGFTFSLDAKVSNLRNPGPDITVDNDGTLGNVRLLTNGYTNQFFKAGSYTNASEAATVFNNLTAPVVPQYVIWADSIKENQIWIFKTADEYYAKMRIISTFSQKRKAAVGDSIIYSECKFEWVYQPDGSLTFPVR
jgi:hypothetical protein